MAPRWLTALCALALAVFGTVLAVHLHAGEGTYRDLARGRGQVTFVLVDVSLTTDESGLVELHRQTLAYILDTAPEPARCCEGRPVFDAAERSHLADVRSVFRAARVAAAVAFVVLVALLIGAARRGHALRLLRDGALWAGGLLVLLAAVAALAFEPAFLAFHYLFFPQGNFLFDPATSNLLRLYPQAYWYGVTLRVGLTFIAAMALLVIAASLALRSRGSGGPRSGIVTRP